MKSITIKDALLFGSQKLKEAGLKKPLRDARILLCFSLKIEKCEMMANLERKMGNDSFAKFRKLIGRRANFEPIQYITGLQPFYNTFLEVGKGCLIPRAETEFLVEEALTIASGIKFPKIADLGCGSGAILKAISEELKKGIFIGIEKSRRSLLWACKNLKECSNCKLILGDYELGAFMKNIDIIVCNPPYITEVEFEKLPQEIRLFEPKSSLITKEVFYFYEMALNFAQNALKKSGFILFEIGAEQAKRNAHFNRISPYFEVHKKIKDYGGKLRVVVLKKISSNLSKD